MTRRSESEPFKVPHAEIGETDSVSPLNQFILSVYGSENAGLEFIELCQHHNGNPLEWKDWKKAVEKIANKNPFGVLFEKKVVSHLLYLAAKTENGSIEKGYQENQDVFGVINSLFLDRSHPRRPTLKSVLDQTEEIYRTEKAPWMAWNTIADRYNKKGNPNSSSPADLKERFILLRNLLRFNPSTPPKSFKLLAEAKTNFTDFNPNLGMLLASNHYYQEILNFSQSQVNKDNSKNVLLAVHFYLNYKLANQPQHQVFSEIDALASDSNQDLTFEQMADLIIMGQASDEDDNPFFHGAIYAQIYSEYLREKNRSTLSSGQFTDTQVNLMETMWDTISGIKSKAPDRPFSLESNIPEIGEAMFETMLSLTEAWDTLNNNKRDPKLLNACNQFLRLVDEIKDRNLSRKLLSVETRIQIQRFRALVHEYKESLGIEVEKFDDNNLRITTKSEAKELQSPNKSSIVISYVSTDNPQYIVSGNIRIPEITEINLSKIPYGETSTLNPIVESVPNNILAEPWVKVGNNMLQPKVNSYMALSSQIDTGIYDSQGGISIEELMVIFQNGQELLEKLEEREFLKWTASWGENVSELNSYRGFSYIGKFQKSFNAVADQISYLNGCMLMKLEDFGRSDLAMQVENFSRTWGNRQKLMQKLLQTEDPILHPGQAFIITVDSFWNKNIDQLVLVGGIEYNMLSTMYIPESYNNGVLNYKTFLISSPAVSVQFMPYSVQDRIVSDEYRILNPFWPKTRKLSEELLLPNGLKIYNRLMSPYALTSVFTTQMKRTRFKALSLEQLPEIAEILNN